MHRKKTKTDEKDKTQGNSKKKRTKKYYRHKWIRSDRESYCYIHLYTMTQGINMNGEWPFEN